MRKSKSRSKQFVKLKVRKVYKGKKKEDLHADDTDLAD